MRYSPVEKQYGILSIGEFRAVYSTIYLVSLVSFYSKAHLSCDNSNAVICKQISSFPFNHIFLVIDISIFQLVIFFS